MTKLIVVSGLMRAALRKLESFAAFDALPIHIGGESGTGKELVARWVHEKSSRARRNFVAVNCASLPDGLVEAELFGHTRGAFTGATQAREGLVAHADGGTLFLDEVADLPPRAQTALLRALQEKEYRRLGEAGLRRSDFRLISASHKNLSEEVQRGRFRQDLFFRLKVVHVELPALRERPADILPLAAHCVRTQSHALGLAPRGFTPEAEQRLEQCGWPGNVRELENEVVQALVRAQEAEAIEARHLSLPSSESRAQTCALGAASLAFEKRFLADSLAAHGGNRTRAARALGLSRQGLYRKLKRLGVQSRPQR